jgi:hypothetical protein
VSIYGSDKHLANVHCSLQVIRFTTMKLNLAAGLFGAVLLNSVEALPQGPEAKDDCRCLPGDACWPAESTWAQLNSTVSGKLVATVPIGSPCHDPTYDAAACDELKTQWTNPLIQYVFQHPSL